MRLAQHAARRYAGIGREPDRLADTREMARVVVPVVVEQRADVHGNRDLVGAHELLEERDARLPLELRVLQSADEGEHPAALRVQRLSKLRERHLSAPVVEIGVRGGALQEVLLALRKAIAA